MAKPDPRAVAARVLAQVMGHGRSLTPSLEQAWNEAGPTLNRALVQELCYGTLRYHPRLETVLAGLLQKPFKPKDADLQALLLLGLYQLTEMRIPDHAAVAETVSATAALGKSWARGLVNAVLRNFQREAQPRLAAADAGEVGRWSHPSWLIERLRQAWPAEWQTVLAANNQRAPMTLRVNVRQHRPEAYLQQLADAGVAAQPCRYSPVGIQLAEAVDVATLPGFATGAVSVQDEAAQLAAGLLQLAPGQRVLDVCAAPGGKTAHILETQSDLALQAVDLDPERLRRVDATLQRLGLAAHLTAGDARQPAAWWDGQPFDRILLDAPCSASGVIRRHPDIKLLRRPGDVQTLVELQAAILDAVWPLLQAGGMLLYATCSVLPAENAQQVAAFLTRHGDAVALPMAQAWGHGTEVGRQILPGDGASDGYGGMDGFYYACLQKRSNS
jgi:16S rRNA (cytosine967-C5)-methyltransferase